MRFLLSKLANFRLANYMGVRNESLKLTSNSAIGMMCPLKEAQLKTGLY